MYLELQFFVFFRSLRGGVHKIYIFPRYGFIVPFSDFNFDLIKSNVVYYRTLLILEIEIVIYKFV